MYKIMKKTTLLIFIVITCSFNLLAQPSFNWVSQIDHSVHDYGISLDIDKNKQTYLTGFSGGSGQGSNGFFIAKSDSVNLAWKFSPAVISILKAEAYKVRVDTLGNIYLLFGLSGTIAFGNDTISSSQGLHLVKLVDSVLQWHIELPRNSIGKHELETNVDGNCYVMSNFLDTEILGSDTIVSSGSRDIFISKISSDGHFVWTQAFGSNNPTRSDIPQGLSLDSVENVYGYYSESYSSSNGHGDSHIIKIDSTGQLLTQTQITGFDQSETEINSFTTSPSGSSYVLLDLYDPTTQIKDTIISVNHHGSVLVVYDNAMNLLSQTVLQDTPNAHLFQPQIIQVDDESQIFVGGKSWQTFHFGQDSIIAGFFIISYDSLMNLNWAKDFATDQWSSTYSRFTDMVSYQGCINFICTAEGNLIHFDSLSFSSSWHDVFWGCLYTLCRSTTSSISPIACDSYVSPSSKYIWTSSGIFMDTIPNVAGCDSIITVNLTIDTVNVSVSNNASTLSANANGATFQWLDCDDNYSVISGETNQSFTANASGNYAVEIIKNGCIDTSACFSIIGVGVDENPFEADFSVYPNPTSGEVTIDFASTANRGIIVVRNMLGQEISKHPFDSPQFVRIFLPGEPGFYLLEIQTADQKMVVKVLKE